MSDKTTIAWTDATWNPVRGCTNCYAERFAERWRGIAGHPFEQGFDVRLVPEALRKPLRWSKPRKVFVNSMSDLFHPDVPDHFIDNVFAVMALCAGYRLVCRRRGCDHEGDCEDTGLAPYKPHAHTFQVLTKRPDRMRHYLCDTARSHKVWDAAHGFWSPDTAIEQTASETPWPLPNVWLGVSVEDQAAADKRIPHLLATPAAVRFVSCEPLLGPVDLFEWSDGPECTCESGPDALPWHGVGCPRQSRQSNIDWCIVGGESGPKARPCSIDDIRSVVDQCGAAGVPCFVKQLGAKPYEEVVHEDDEEDDWCEDEPLDLRDRAGADMDEWPADLRVREWPEVRHA